MAEYFREGANIHAAFNGTCRKRVAEGMKPSLVQPGSFQNAMIGTQEIARFKRGPKLRTKNEVMIRPCTA